MFFDELTPIVKELIQQPMAFLGGFCSGVLRLNLADRPVKSWLDRQTASTSCTSATHTSSNGKNERPQSIVIE